MSEFVQATIFLLVLVTTCLASTALEQNFLIDRDELKPWFLSDLTVSSIEPPFYTNGRYVVQVTVRNLGRGTAGPTNLHFRDNNFQSSQFRQVGRLAPRQAAAFQFVVSAPENQGPYWYFSAIADYGNAIREMNENNNVKHYYD